MIDAVCHAPDGCAKVHMVGKVAIDCVIPQYDVHQLALAVWHKHGLPDRAIVQQAHACAGRVRDGIPQYRLAGRQMPKFGNGNAHVLETSIYNRSNNGRNEYLLYYNTLARTKKGRDKN